MSDVTIGIIGGTGLERFRLPGGLQFTHEKYQDTGLRSAEINGVETYFLPRHRGKLPHQVDYARNMRIMREVKADVVVGVTACGLLQAPARHNVQVQDWALVNDFIDLTGYPPPPYEIIEHPESVDVYRSDLRRAIKNAFSVNKIPNVHQFGTMVSIRGPRFASAAEANMYRGFGAHLINMTTGPETEHALWARLPYVVLAFVTDIDGLDTKYNVIKGRFAAAEDQLQQVLPVMASNLAAKVMNGRLLTNQA